METVDITKLARVLRENGAEVLNGKSKLTLSSDLLNHLNESFSLVIDQRDVMNSSFHVINTSSTKLEVFTDLQFLHDFVQRASGLKLTPTNDKQEFTDITKFKNIKLFEVQKVAIKSIVGIQAIRSQLQFLICMRCLDYLADILEKCGGDESAGYPWHDLREAVFSHNGLQVIDDSLKFATSLNMLDLSHNEIKDATPLNCLPNIKYLNLSYNKLVNIPALAGQLCNRLKVLVINNNFIEDINEVSILSNLCELQLSENCLIEHNSLVPLANLATLQVLSLHGNPLSYHPSHRTKTTSCLHVNIGTVRFLLDGVVLSKSEQRLVGSLHPRVLMHEIQTVQRVPASEIQPDKPRRIRNAKISDNDESPIIDASIGSASSLITSMEHLETKWQIELLKQQYGDNWLHDKGGSLVQDVLGMEKSVPLSSTPYGKADIMIHAENKAKACEELKEPEVKVEDVSVYVTASDETLPVENAENSLYANAVDVAQISSDDEDLGDGEETIFLITRKDETDPVFLVITPTHIIEKESDTTREISRWGISSLKHCETNDGYLQLYFDTVKNDKKERQYVLDEEDADSLQKLLRNIIENRLPDDSQFILFKCLKCSTQFTKEKNKQSDEVKNECPACKSQMVFEDNV